MDKDKLNFTVLVPLTNGKFAHFIFSHARELTAKRMHRELAKPVIGISPRPPEDILRLMETYKPKDVFTC